MTIALVGAGVMGEAVLSSLVTAVGSQEKVLVAERRPERAEELLGQYEVEIVDNADAARRADTLVMVVKPQDLPALLEELAPSLSQGPEEGSERAAGPLLVSLVAGVPTSAIEALLPGGVAVVRVMPNTPALLGEGMAAIAAGSRATSGHLDHVTDLLSGTGTVLRVPESQMDAVTAVSGSGPAYVFYVAEAMVEAGVHLGLSRATSTDLVVQTLVGSAAMLRDTKQHPSMLREQVTSPAGTTAAALAELDAHAVRAAFLAAVRAAHDRSQALSNPNPAP